MKATSLLKRDHLSIHALFREFERCAEDDGAGRKRVFDRLRTEVEAHMDIEEELFYPEVMRIDEAEDLVREARTEHQLVRDLLGEIGKLGADDPDYRAKVLVLEENLQHHIDEEESEMFPLVKENWNNDRQEKLGDRLEQRRNERMRPRKTEPA